MPWTAATQYSERFLFASVTLFFCSIGCQFILSAGEDEQEQGPNPREVVAHTGGGTSTTPNPEVGGSAGAEAQPQTESLDAGSAGSGGTAPSTDPTQPCEVGTCCIQGKPYFPRAPNPDNPCELCQPSVNATRFSPIANGTGCGTGCICSDGKRAETRCADVVDNDTDGKLDCNDGDCFALLCHRNEQGRSLDVTRDFRRGHQGVEEDGQKTIGVFKHPGGGEHWSAVLEFSDIPVSSAINVVEATLGIYVEEGGTALRVLDPSGNQLAYLAPIGKGHHNFDVTRLVKAWVLAKEHRRQMVIEYGANGAEQIVFRSSEYGDSTSPELVIKYESSCDLAGTCPKIRE